MSGQDPVGLRHRRGTVALRAAPIPLRPLLIGPVPMSLVHTILSIPGGRRLCEARLDLPALHCYLLLPVSRSTRFVVPGLFDVPTAPSAAGLAGAIWSLGGPYGYLIDVRRRESWDRGWLSSGLSSDALLYSLGGGLAGAIWSCTVWLRAGGGGVARIGRWFPPAPRIGVSSLLNCAPLSVVLRRCPRLSVGPTVT